MARARIDFAAGRIVLPPVNGEAALDDERRRRPGERGQSHAIVEGVVEPADAGRWRTLRVVFSRCTFGSALDFRPTRMVSRRRRPRKSDAPTVRRPRTRVARSISPASKTIFTKIFRRPARLLRFRI